MFSSCIYNFLSLSRLEWRCALIKIPVLSFYQKTRPAGRISTLLLYGTFAEMQLATMVYMQTVPRLYETFQPSNYDLQLDLDRQNRRFSGSVTISGNKTAAPGHIALHAKELTITSAKIDGVTDTRFETGEFDQLILDAQLTEGPHTVTLTFEGVITDAMHGLYPCYYDVNGEQKELLATQFESHHAREVFPCIDEPEAKATFSLSIGTEAGVTVLSNMPAAHTEATGDRTITTFETTPKMSTYLLAFVTGEMQKQSAKTKSGVEVTVWATHAQSAGSLAFPLEVAVGCIDFFDDYFGIPYPLPKADHVALPDFGSGAMENWGLITYREIALLVDEQSSVSTREYVATVVAHETSHQWFGNLVTMKWWDDLWLNESFATIMEYVAVDALYPKWNVWNTFASQESLSALRRDQLAGVQAVKCEVNHPDEISTLFDPSIVYAKGGRLLKMLRSYIGEDAFRSGLQSYFQQHAYSNTTGADLWEAFSKSSGKNIGEFMATWISQAGLPVVSVTTTENGYRLAQQHFVVGAQPSESTWPIPLFAFDSSFPELLDTAGIEIAAGHPLPLLNVSNDAHFVAAYDESAWELIRNSLAKNEIDTIPRLSLLHETSLLARGGKTNAATLIPLLAAYRNETTEPVWNIMSMVIGDLKRFVEDDEESEKRLKRIVSDTAYPLFDQLGFNQINGESEEHVKLRATIIGLLCYAEDPGVIQQCLDAFRSMKDVAALASETRAIVFSVAAKHGNADDFMRLITLHEATANAELRDDITSGLCSTKEPRHIDLLIDRLKNAKLVKQQDLFRWYIYLLRNRFARDKTWQWMTDNWPWIEETFKGDKSYDDFPRYSAGVLSTPSWLEAYQEFFSPMKTQTALKRAIEIGEVEIQSRAQWLSRDTDLVRATLAQETA